MTSLFSRFKIDDTKRAHGTVLLLASVIAGVLAQLTLQLADESTSTYWDLSQWWQTLGNIGSPFAGLLLYALAGLLFVLGLKNLNETPETFPVAVTSSEPRPVRFGYWVTSLGLAGLLAYYSAVHLVASPGDGYGLLFVWLLSIGLIAYTVLARANWQHPSSEQLKQWLKDHRIEILIVAVILTAAFVIRFWNVELYPYSFINDEGEMGKGGQCIIKGLCTTFFDMGWASEPALAFLPAGISVALFGNTATAVRLGSVITGTLAVLAVYLFSREVFSRRTAVVAALILTTLPVQVHFSRIGVNNIVDSLSAPLVLWLLFRGAKRNSAADFLGAGIISGLCMYTYPGSRLTPFLALGSMIFMAFRARSFLRVQAFNILSFVLSAIVTASPIIGYFYANPDQFSARMRSEGIFQNGALQNEVLATGHSALQVLTEQFLRSSLVFITSSAPSGFYNSPRPYLNGIAAFFLMFGLVLALWRIKDTQYIVLLAWFFAAIILGSTITGGPPSSQRMLMSSSALAVIAAAAAVKLFSVFQKYGPKVNQVAPILLAALLLISGFNDLNFYFKDYSQGHYFEDPTNELTYETRVMIAPLHDTGRFYLIGSPGVFVVFANFDFFAPDVEKADFDEVTREKLAALPKDKDVLFIAPIYRAEDIQKIQEWIPGGVWTVVNRRTQPNQVLYYAYQLSAVQLQAFKP